MHYTTEQEAFWAGEFGTDYARRNSGAHLLAANLSLFSRALQHTAPLASCIEFGANIGMNLAALKLLFPAQEHHAVEINPTAAAELAKIVHPANITQGSILEFVPRRTWDLVLIKGVLIHQDPAALPKAYDVLYRATAKYLLLCEYYSPTPVEVGYRGHANKLFKRDFAGELLDRFPSLKLHNYGFLYHRDSHFPADDANWFLLEKRD